MEDKYQKFLQGIHDGVDISIGIPVDDNNLVLADKYPVIFAEPHSNRESFFETINPEKPFIKMYGFKEMAMYLRLPQHFLALRDRIPPTPRHAHHCEQCLLLAVGEVYDVYLHLGPDTSNMSLLHRFGSKDYQYASFLVTLPLFMHLETLEHNAPIHRREQTIQETQRVHEL